MSEGDWSSKDLNQAQKNLNTRISRVLAVYLDEGLDVSSAPMRQTESNFCDVDWCSQCNHCFTCSFFSKEVHAIFNSTLSESMMDMVEYQLLTNIDKAYEIVINVTTSDQRVDDDTTNSTCSLDDIELATVQNQRLSKRNKKHYSSQVLMENWDYDNMYADSTNEVACNHCYPCSFFCKEVHSYVHARKISPPNFRGTLDFTFKRQLTTSTELFLNFVKLAKFNHQTYLLPSSSVPAMISEAFAQLICDIVRQTQQKKSDLAPCIHHEMEQVKKVKGITNDSDISRVVNNTNRTNIPPKASSPNYVNKKTVNNSKPLSAPKFVIQKGSTISNSQRNTEKQFKKDAFISDLSSTCSSKVTSTERKPLKPLDTAKITGTKSGLKTSNISSALETRRAVSKKDRSPASETAKRSARTLNSKASTSPKPSSPSPHMRIGSPFKKSVVGKSNPKPFGMGRSEFHAFTYQGQVGGSNRKVVKSKSFVNEREPDKLADSKRRRNSLPSKLHASHEKSVSTNKIRNKYSHVTAKTDSGIRRSSSGILSDNLRKKGSPTIHENEGFTSTEDRSAVQVCQTQSLTAIETEDKNEDGILDTLNTEADMEIEKIDSMATPDSPKLQGGNLNYEKTSKRIEMGVIRICSPDVPVFYASHGKGKTSPTFSDYDQREAMASPSAVMDEEDVSICVTPDITGNDAAKLTNQCWSLKCNHVVNDKIIDADIGVSQSRNTVVSNNDHHEEQMAGELQVREVRSPDEEIYFGGSKGSPTSETVESSIFVDSMLTTIYSGEEYTRNESVSKNVIIPRAPDKDESNDGCRASESSSPSFLSATLEEVSQGNEQNEVDNSQVQKEARIPELEHSREYSHNSTEKVCQISSPKPVIKSSSSYNSSGNQECNRQTKMFDDMLTQYQNDFMDCSYIDDAVKKLDTMVDDNSEHSMSIDEYLRAFTPLYDTVNYSPMKSSPCSQSIKSSPVSEYNYRSRRVKSGTRSKSVSPTSSMGSAGRRKMTEKQIPRKSKPYLGSCRSMSSCTFNDTALDEEIRKIETKCSSGSESENEPLSETLGRVEFVLDEITKMGTRKMATSLSRQSGKSSLSSSPFLNYKWEDSVTPSKFFDDSIRNVGKSFNPEAKNSQEKNESVTADQMDMSRILSKIDKVKDDVRREKAVLKTTIQQTHDLLGFQSQVAHMQISSTPDLKDRELELWRKESFELLREHEAALQKILKYERKLDKLRTFMKAIARKRTVIETRIQSRMSVNTGTPRGTPCGTPRTRTPVQPAHAISRKKTANLCTPTSRLPLPGPLNLTGFFQPHSARQNSDHCPSTNGRPISNPVVQPKRSTAERKHSIMNFKNEAVSDAAQRRKDVITQSTLVKNQEPRHEKMHLQTVPNSEKQQMGLATSKHSKISKQTIPSNAACPKDRSRLESHQKDQKMSMASIHSEPIKKASLVPSTQSEVSIHSEAPKKLNSHEQTNITTTRSRDLLMQLPKYEGHILNSPCSSTLDSKSSKNLNPRFDGKSLLQQKVTIMKDKKESRKNCGEIVSDMISKHLSSGTDKKQSVTDQTYQLPIENSFPRNRHGSNGSTSSAITISSSSSGVTLDETKPCKIDRSCIVDKYISSESLSYEEQDEQVVHGVIIGDKVLVRGRKNNEKLHEDFMIEARQFHDRLY